MSPLRSAVFPSALVLIIGLAIGAAAAFALRDEVTVTGQTDPCFGLGELISTRTYTVSERGAENARTIGLDLTPGEERELRECRINPIERVTIDGPTGTVVNHTLTIDEAIAYYEVHPEELPASVSRRETEQSLQESFVPAHVPADLTAGCDPSWLRTTLEKVQAVVCHPGDWMLTADNAPEGAISGGTASVGVLGLNTEAHNTKCASPALVSVSSGTARICAFGPSLDVRVNYGVALPNGRNVGINVLDDATPEDEALALRIAANVQSVARFVPVDLPGDVMGGCDQSWVRTTFEQVQAVICHPVKGEGQFDFWVVRQHNPVSAAVGTDSVQVSVLGLGIASHNTQCASPTLLDVPSGAAQVCAVDASGIPRVRGMYGMALPNGRNIAITISDEATAEEEATALRVAANVESLP